MNQLRLTKITLCLPFLFLFSCSNEESSKNINENKIEQESLSKDFKETIAPVLVIHGGAGYMLRENFTEAQIETYENALRIALETGYSILEKGGSSSEAVIKAIQILEKDSLFNAGIGAVLTHEKTVSLDASFMDGATGQAGAVSGISTVKSPIELAYTIMQKSPHVMLSGAGAESFAQSNNLEMVVPSYFITQDNLKRINKILEEENTQSAYYDSKIKGLKMGTVGALALDKQGNLAAGTSTGGMANKKHGRIGDSPIIGAGTYADNSTCAVSATGHGEFFMRNVVAYDVAARMKYKNSSLKEAAQATIDHLATIKGDGGIIALDNKGNIAMPFNTSGMFRAYAKPNGDIFIEIFE
jgi:beta-aspartyl-peptidase (threonine type)